VLAPATPAEALPAPRYAKPSDPWIYRGTYIPADPQWLFGEMPNGLRYAVRQNSVPPGQVSIRIRIDAGSLYETESEQGFAHLIEHLTFRESKYLGNNQAIPTWQRLGASFGSDTNAQTTPTQTVYKLDLPNVSRPALDESMKLLSGMIEAPALSDANLKTEVPIVLAERRERTGADERVAKASRETLFAGQLLAERPPIGTVETLQAATPIGPRDVRPTPTGRIIIEAANGRIPAFIDTGLNLVHVDDVASGHLAALRSGKIGERYILGGQNVLFSQLLRDVAGLVGRRPARVRLPWGALIPVALFAEGLARITGREPFATLAGVYMARHRMFYASTKAERELSYQSRPYIEGIKDAVRWFRDAGYLTQTRDSARAR